MIMCVYPFIFTFTAVVAIFDKSFSNTYSW